MAVLKKNKVKGRIGKVVSREHLGQEVLQAFPKNYENSIRSQISACEGAIASSSGRIIRELLKPLHCNFDTMVHSRLMGKLKASIHQSKTGSFGVRDLHDANLSRIKGFQLNNFSHLDKILEVRPQADLVSDGRILLSIGKISAEKDIKSPAAFSDVILRFLFFAVNFRYEKTRYLECKDFIIPNTVTLEAQEYFIDFQVPDGTLLFITCSLHWRKKVSVTGYQVINTREYSPAEIIGVWKAKGEEALSPEDSFSNNDITDEDFRWDDMAGYAGPVQLAKAAELLKLLDENAATAEKKPVNPERFPLN